VNAPRCQMACGACAAPAVWSLAVGDEDVPGISFLRARVLVACDRHRPALERCGRVYGERGEVEPVADGGAR